MRHAAVQFVVALLLAGCDRLVPEVDALAADPPRLRALRAQCRDGVRTPDFCDQVAQADLQRFLSGQAGADEYQTLDDLPLIPGSFDGPAEHGESANKDLP